MKVLEVDPIHHRIVMAATAWPLEDIIPPTPPALVQPAQDADPQS